MTNRQRIESLDDLNAYLFDLFGPHIEPSGTDGYSVMFMGSLQKTEKIVR
jgi:hypothetical protein